MSGMEDELRSNVADEGVAIDQLNNELSQDSAKERGAEDELRHASRGGLSRAFVEAKQAVVQRVSQIMTAVSLRLHWHQGQRQHDEELEQEIASNRDAHSKLTLDYLG